MSPKEALPALSFLGDGSDRSAFLSERSHQADPFDADLQLENHFPELAPWGSLLDRLEVPRPSRLEVAVQARVNGTTFLQELSVCGLVTEASLHRALAEELGVEFLDQIEPDKLVVKDRECLTLLGRPIGTAQIGLQDKQSMNVLMDTRRVDIERMKDWVQRAPDLASRLKIAPPSVLRRALFQRGGAMLASLATNRLGETHPDYSARIVVNAWQGFVCGVAAVAFPVALIVAPAQTMFGVHIFFTFFFLACVALRFAATATARPAEPFLPKTSEGDKTPTYSVLIALYKEAEIISELLAALDALVWPRSKLEIKLICEADDTETLQAIRAHKLPSVVEVIEVPVHGPRTKPKALAYALPATSGEYVVLYDAEDRPHPLQLVEASQRFRDGGPRLACLQAPLEISNRDQGPMARLFAFEYAALFRGLLPWLAARSLLLPLGGTSNHFRRSVLDEIGGWDPYNVTEDADLGLRLARFGYRVETIRCPTYEDAPEDLKTWLPQRTRWFKGWLQTWLVHMRNPRLVAGDLGLRSVAVLNVLFAGMLISAIANPFLIASAVVLAADLAKAGVPGTFSSALLLIDVANICCGYLSFLLLGRQTLRPEERKGFWKIVLFTPVYWLMMSVAGLRSIYDIIRRPHHWEKTTHRRSRFAADA